MFYALPREEPEHDDKVTIDGRLWLIAKARDASGSVQLGCPEKTRKNSQKMERKRKLLSPVKFPSVAGSDAAIYTAG